MRPSRVGLSVSLTAAALVAILATVHSAAASAIGPWSQSTVADFSGCSVLTNTVISDLAGGEIRLAAALEDDFSGATIDFTRWITNRYYTWGGFDPFVAGGVLNLDGSSVRSLNSISGEARVMEFRARLRPSGVNMGWPALGLGRQSDPAGSGSGQAHRLWEGDDSGGLAATARDGGAANQFQSVSGIDLTQYHVFRIEWSPFSTAYAIDGSPRVTLTASSSVPAWAWLYTLNPGSRVEVDWVRVTPYASTTGTFVSCPIDAAEITNWGNLTWVGSTPPGTSITLETRSSVNGAVWSAWSSPATASGSPIQSPAGRYLQYRITLASVDATASPEVRQVIVTAQTGWQAFTTSWRMRFTAFS